MVTAVLVLKATELVFHVSLGQSCYRGGGNIHLAHTRISVTRGTRLIEFRASLHPYRRRCSVTCYSRHQKKRE